MPSIVRDHLEEELRGLQSPVEGPVNWRSLMALTYIGLAVINAADRIVEAINKSKA